MTEDDIKTLKHDPDGLQSYEYLANHIGECDPDAIEKIIDNMERVDLSGQFMASAASLSARHRCRWLPSCCASTRSCNYRQGS